MPRRTYKRIYASLESRFWKFVKKTDNCWFWTGSRNTEGYGHIGRRGRGNLVKAHRISWEIHNGPIPDGMCVLHKCDVPSCVNPNHLFLGTKADNSRDMLTKGRGNKAKGVKNGANKLTEEDVLEIRRIYAEGGTSQARLGGLFDVGQTQIYHIVNNKQWAWLDVA